MINAIKAAVGPLISSHPVSISPTPDIFEAYIFSIIITAAKAEGATVIFQDRSGNPATALIFRTSPGYIFSNSKNYTHAVISFPSRPTLEAHIGIKVTGKSGVLHEADVAVLDSAETENCRLNSVSPRSSKVLMAVECKYYCSTLQLSLARSFVGLVSDFSVREPYFVTNTNSASVEKLLSHRVKHWEKDITPSCNNGEVDRLTFEFRSAFKYYKAR